MIAAAMLAAVLAALLAWLAAGMAIARRRMPVIWRKARAAWHFEDSIRGSVRGQVACTVIAWPVVLLTAVLTTRIDRLADQGDPVTLARQVAERDRRIAQLERELGIGGPG